MKRALTLLLAALSAGAVGATDLHVATTGNDANPGTADQPLLTIHKAVELVEPGQTIWVHGGTYKIAERIKIPKKATTKDLPINLFAYNDETVVVDGSDMRPANEAAFKMARCFYLNHEVNHWHIRGLEICNALDNGMKVEGSYNVIERCVFHDNNDTGLQIGMYKDFSIEETKQLPAGSPKFNPDWQFCRGNQVINCDSYNNYDRKTFSGEDDGGDADGFACKLFPGPGTVFRGCRAWNNSDDNWDLYMVYYPVVIDHCWAWKAGYDKDGNATGANGNGFKLGGGGSAGGAAFDQSTGAHLVTNCVSFDNAQKGFDQNNAYEGMYIINCTAWGNNFNYRFPTVFKYGTVTIRNCVGFRALDTKSGNHEFLSADKAGSKTPDTDFNSWTTLDECNPYKEMTKNANRTTDYTGEFLSLSVDDAKAPRQADGSLPDNNFARLKDNSKLIDQGTPIENFNPAPKMTEAEALAAGLERVTLPPITIYYNGAKPDFGAYESGTPTYATLKLKSGALAQKVYTGEAIESVVLEWGGAATDVAVNGAPASITAAKDAQAKTLTLSGTLSADATITVATVDGDPKASAELKLTVSTVRAATLVCSTNNASQSVNSGAAIGSITYTAGGGATAIAVTGLPSGLTSTTNGLSLTISGTPTASGRYTVSATGGMDPLSLAGSIEVVIPTRVLTGDWYNIQDAFDALPKDLQGVVSIAPTSTDANAPQTTWDAARTESGTVPAGCTAGAVDLLKEGGYLEWKLPSLAELRVNLHFTGGRTFEVQWQAGGETEWHTASTGSLKKATLTGYDLMDVGGIESTQRPITVRLVNKAGSGGARVYDFYVKVYDAAGGSSEPAAQPEEDQEDGEALGVVQPRRAGDGRAYDLMGRPLGSNARGLVIVDGRLMLRR